MEVFFDLARKRQTELMAKKTQHVPLEWKDEKILEAIDKRLKSMDASKKNVKYTLDQLLRFMNARLWKPQRLRKLVRKPKMFRRNVRNPVIVMSDQSPMWLKLKPGKQVYAEFECKRDHHHELNLGNGKTKIN